MIVWILFSLNYDMGWDVDAVFETERAAINAKQGLSGTWHIQSYEVVQE